MASITLHRASRMEVNLREAIRATELSPNAAISIFASDVPEVVTRRRDRLLAQVDRLERLLGILGRLRAAVQKANAEIGISALLTEKAGLEEWLKIIAPLLPAPGFSSAMPTAIGVEELTALVAAARRRYENPDASGRFTGRELELPLLRDEDAAALSQRIIAARRQLDRIADHLRELNATVRIEFSDEDLAWLQRDGVI